MYIYICRYIYGATKGFANDSTFQLPALGLPTILYTWFFFLVVDAKKNSLGAYTQPTLTMPFQICGSFAVFFFGPVVLLPRMVLAFSLN